MTANTLSYTCYVNWSLHTSSLYCYRDGLPIHRKITYGCVIMLIFMAQV